MCDHVAQWDGVERRDIAGIPEGCGFFKQMPDFHTQDERGLCNGYLLAAKPGNWAAVAHVPVFGDDDVEERSAKLAEWYAKLPEKEGAHACPEGYCTADITPHAESTA